MARPILIGNGAYKANSGFAYLALLAALAVLALVLSSASVSQSHKAKRERETQLFFIGEQFYNALASYYAVSQQETDRYPKTLAQLLVDNRAIKPRHHLRQIYQDPMTHTYEWGLVLNSQKQIIGIYSLSDEVLLKSKLPEFAVIEGNQQALYSNLKFIYRPSNKAKPAQSEETDDFQEVDSFGDGGDDDFNIDFNTDFDADEF